MSIQSEIGRIQAARDAIAGAITAKGVAVPDSTRIDGMAEKIAAIKTTPALQKQVRHAGQDRADGTAGQRV